MNDQPRENPSLESLNKQLEELKKTQAAKSQPLGPSSDAAKAAIDFASASAVGGLLGYGADRYFGSAPWGIVIGLVVGVVAGIYTMLKTEAQRARKQNEGNE